MGARGFFSSFENTDPPLTWIDTVDIDEAGRPRAVGAVLSTREGGGPGKPYTGKAGVGFTGRRALRYQGSHPGRGGARVVNRLFLVDMLVARDTERYFLRPVIAVIDGLGGTAEAPPGADGSEPGKPVA